MNADRLEYIRQKVEDGMSWMNIESQIEWMLEEMVLDRVITRAEKKEAIVQLDWRIVILEIGEKWMSLE